ncbi:MULTISPECIES: DUF3307 domain-containing protein [Pseudoalteromonas]|uniref:DUF3307 domain-containing protein n=1 Tax=Pseudoalteromonas maricaloris TaxID=184924 RepID=A0A8I2H6T1_9GAMM|nr:MULTISPECIES: DUF3307 domain-containing protein [Pseudoalteromonas]KID35535.1 hypothetical protein QT15_14855 [Pseudoalteromonas flavipulchra NCIMB 2033 = ATCC BAA-314]MBD0780794.1 DUF3307 domain-containing protein [Pseudoalteromonas flavipulchra]MBE0375595.1 hypothetical protein [Pseudoalteromonas flavipulchra NCIMB 2033 = ATCC BAA-314]NLR22229.1 DUF3307 domain-containing protein [Pseudoalteromonas maricaloris]RZG12748.1 DUF3307 domain-containing protein [Pseudoalteromonas sp. CO342X]
MNEWQVLLLWLVIGHTITDFYLQPMSWVHDRNTRHYKSIKLLWHSVAHGGVALAIILLWQSTLFWGAQWNALLFALAVGISHYCIDLAKSYSSKGVIPFVLDQCAHIIILVAVTWHIAEPEIALSAFTKPFANVQLLILVVGYLMVLHPASVFTSMLLERWQLNNSALDSLPQAGSLIGQLERVLLLSCVLLDSWAAIGFILAAKSVFRFGDLTQSQDRKLTEYVMLGTLVSVLLALVVGVLIKPFMPIQL